MTDRSAGDALALPVWRGTELADRLERWPVTHSHTAYTGKIVDLVVDDVTTPDGGSMTREWVRHPGAVSVIAVTVVDGEDHVVVLRQFRHPVGGRLIEPPAGLLDVAEEHPQVAAARELAEEVGLAAADWRVLADIGSSPGMTSETIRIFLARDLRPTDRPDGFVAEAEEAELEVATAPLADLVTAILAGDLQCPTLVAGCLAAWAARRGSGWDALRPADSPWPIRR